MGLGVPADVSVILPTYEEHDNIGPLIEGIASAVPGLKEIIVVDDDSPDETWRVAEEMRAFPGGAAACCSEYKPLVLA